MKVCYKAYKFLNFENRFIWKKCTAKTKHSLNTETVERSKVHTVRSYHTNKTASVHIYFHSPIYSRSQHLYLINKYICEWNNVI